MAVESNSLPFASLYVGDLDHHVSETDLLRTFSAIARVASVRICYDFTSGNSLGYGYVNFFSRSDACKALDSLNHILLKGKKMRIMWSQRDPSLRKTGIANLFVKNLDLSIDSAALQKIFGKFGAILSCKVAEENGKSKGFGYVQFESEEAAQSAMKALHESAINGKTLYVSNFVKKNEKKSANIESEFTNVYVKNLENGLTDDVLEERFSVFGKVQSAVVMKDEHGKSRGFGFVNFDSPEEAKKAVEYMNGTRLGSKNIYVGRAQKKEERRKILGCQFKGLNVFVKNLDRAVDDEKLKEHFSICGKIISTKVMVDNDGLSRGFGFIRFSTPDGANNALTKFHGTMLYGKPLYVAIAQSKEERQSTLKLQHGGHAVSLPHMTPFPSYFHSSYSFPATGRSISQINPYQPIMCQDFDPNQCIYFPPMTPIYSPTFSRKETEAKYSVNEHPLLETPQNSTLFSYYQPYLNPTDQGTEQKQATDRSYAKQYQERRGPSKHQQPSFYKEAVKKSSSSLGSANQGSAELRKILRISGPKHHKKMLCDRFY